MSAVRLRPTTERDIPWVMAAERHPDNAPMVGSWTEAQHCGALTDTDLAHWLVSSLEEDRTVGFAILQGRREAHLHQGEFVSLVIMSILEEEYRRS